jgi:outer membrane protein OmpA-like peptidoglycan-associated protein/ABC-type amino acid transport substrate-binding protein
VNIHVRIATGLLLLGTVLGLGYKFLWPQFDLRRQADITDARGTKGRILIGVDSWIGYYPLCGDEMRKRLRVQGYVLQCEDDKADYAKRFSHLKSGRLQFAVSTVDAYLSNGAGSAFPGAVVAVIDESKGGDALVAWKDKVTSLEGLKSAQTPRIAFTPGSPSEHLLRSASVHFDIAALRKNQGNWRVETSGSDEALKALLSRKADAAVLWEPDVSRALATPGVVKLLSTAETQRLIVDVLIAGREVLQQDPQMVQVLLATYFDVVRHYREQPEQLARDVALETKVEGSQIKAMLGGVAWAGLSDNAQVWLGATVSSNGLVDVIQSTLRVLTESGALPADPLPNGDPYRIISSQFVASVYTAATTTGSGAAASSLSDAGVDQRFAALSDAQWDALREVGSLKSLNVSFQSGTAELNFEGKSEVDQMMEVLRHYPSFRIRVRGHTGLGGDEQENKKLSRERADAVVRYLSVTYNLDPHRARVIGLGASQPLARMPGEADRAYQYRLPRVEIALLAQAL